MIFDSESDSCYFCNIEVPKYYVASAVDFLCLYFSSELTASSNVSRGALIFGRSCRDSIKVVLEERDRN